MAQGTVAMKDIKCCCTISLSYDYNELTIFYKDNCGPRKIHVTIPDTHNGFISGEPKILAIRGRFAILRLPVRDTIKSVLFGENPSMDESKLVVIDVQNGKVQCFISLGYLPGATEVEMFNFDISNDGSFMAIACGLLHDKSARSCKYHAFVKVFDSVNGDIIYEQECDRILPPAILFCKDTNDFFTLYCDTGSETPMLRQFTFEPVHKESIPENIRDFFQHKLCYRIKLKNKIEVDAINVEDEVYTNIHISKDKQFFVLQIIEAIYPNNEFLCKHFILDAQSFHRLNAKSSVIIKPCHTNCVTCGHMAFRPQDSACGSKFVVPSYEPIKQPSSNEICDEHIKHTSFDYPVVINLKHNARTAVLQNVHQEDICKLPMPKQLLDYLHFIENDEGHS